MNEKTEEDYRKLAAHFYKTKMGPSTAITPKGITDALLAVAGDYRPGSFGRLKAALAFDQKEKGFDKAAQRIKAVQNPLTAKDAPVMLKRQVKPKRKQIKAVDSSDLLKMAEAIKAKGDRELMAALILVNTLGCRANEIMDVRALGNGQVYVPGSKKAEFEARGRKITRGDVDRVLELGSPVDEQRVEWAVGVLSEAEPGKSGVVHKMQSRMDRLAKKLWPRRKAHITLKSFRHQLGADLKASGLDRQTVAYIMGHESTESVEAYGDRRKASQGRNIKPAVSQEKINEVVRDKHKEQAFQSRTKQEKSQVRTSTPGQEMGL